MEGRRADIAAAIQSVDIGRGVIVLTDLFGGTPSNLAISLMERGRVEVIAGMNLPMLIRLGSARKSMKVVDAVAGRARGRPQIYLRRLRGAGRGGGMTVRRTVAITNRRGLHARASAKFVTLASTQPCEVQVEKDSSSVTGTSIMGLMMLGAAKGDSITISADGDGPKRRSRRWSRWSRASSARIEDRSRGRLSPGDRTFDSGSSWRAQRRNPQPRV